MKKILEYAPAPVFMLFGQRLGICTVPESDTLGAVTRLMMKYLIGRMVR